MMLDPSAKFIWNWRIPSRVIDRKPKVWRRGRRRSRRSHDPYVRRRHKNRPYANSGTKISVRKEGFLAGLSMLGLINRDLWLKWWLWDVYIKNAVFVFDFVFGSNKNCPYAKGTFLWKEIFCTDKFLAVGLESHDRTALPRRNQPEIYFSFPESHIFICSIICK